MNNQITYKTGEIVQLGDRVIVRSYFFIKDIGTVVYIPHVSNFHPEMEEDGIEHIGVKLDVKAIAAATIDPKSKIVLNTKFVERGIFDESDALNSEEEIFEDDDGMPL